MKTVKQKFRFDYKLLKICLKTWMKTYKNTWVLINHVTFIDDEPIIFTKYDEPRIGGYPDTIIRSADQMFKAMKTGLTNWEGKQLHFHWEKEREEHIKNHITTFFNKYPDGIIEMGIKIL